MSRLRSTILRPIPLAVLSLILTTCGRDESIPLTPMFAPTPTLGPALQNLAIVSTPGVPELGYQYGEIIAIEVQSRPWSDSLEVIGSPTLRLGLGKGVRYAELDDVYDLDHSRGVSTILRFTYFVQSDDHAPNGIVIFEDAIELNGGEIVTSRGELVSVDLGDSIGRVNTRVHAVRATTPFPDVIDCDVERQQARRLSRRVTREWNGLPFRVDIVDNFPSFVSKSDLRELLAPIGEAADKIERQIGYRILEMGDIVPIPPGTPTGWNLDWERYWRANPPMLERKRGQLLAFFMDDDTGRRWDEHGGSPMSAHYVGTTSYNRRAMGEWWDDRDPCCVGRSASNGRHGAVIVHEIFHLLGFSHPDASVEIPGARMAWGSLMSPWLSGSKVHFVADKDIEVLKCIYPRR